MLFRPLFANSKIKPKVMENVSLSYLAQLPKGSRSLETRALKHAAES